MPEAAMSQHTQRGDVPGPAGLVVEAAQRPPTTRGGGVHAAAWRCGDRIECRVGLDATWVADRERPGAQGAGGNATAPGSVCVILDDTSKAEPFWAPDPRAHLCAMTVVVYEIARWVHAEGRDVLVSFLGLDRVFPVDRGTTLAAIEQALQDLRRDEDPSCRGWYAAPVLDALARQRAGPVRAVLIGDSPVPDLAACRRDGGVELERLWLSPAARTDGICESAPDRPVLFPHPEPEAGGGPDALRRQLDTAVIETRFARTTGLDEVAIRLSGAPPVQWRPTTAALSRDGDGFVLDWRLGGASAGVLHARILAGVAPAALTCDLRRRSESGRLTVRVPCEPAPPPPAGEGDGPLSEPPAAGVLPESELDLWALLCDPARPCDECGRRGGHLLHRGDAKLYGRPILRSHARLQAGWVCQRAGAPDWRRFDTGVELEGGAVVLLDRRPHWVAATGAGPGAAGTRVEPLPRNDDEEFVLAAGGTTWHVAELVGKPGAGEGRP